MANDNVQFRSKFLEKVAGFSMELLSKIEEINHELEGLSNPHFLKFLWGMTYDPASTLKPFGLLVESNDTPDEEQNSTNDVVIPGNLIIPWRNTLRYQRSSVNNDFLVVNVPESCKNAYKALLDASSDKIISVVAYQACDKLCRISSQEDINRVLGLLSSSKDEFRFGGIRSLHFNKPQAIVLKGYASQLHNLLEALWNEECTRTAANANTPMKELLQQWWEKHNSGDSEEVPADETPAKEISTAEATVEGTPAEANETEEKQTPTEPDGSTSQLPTPQENLEEGNPPLTNPENMEETTSPTEKAITAGNLYADEALFEKFLAICQELQEAGYDCKKVVGKLDAIAKILEASKLLSE